MISLLSKFILNVLRIFDILLKINKSLISYALYQDLRENYIKVKVKNQNLVFHSPNSQIDFRVKTIFTKEPETIKWINEFKIENDSLFWDIGSNIGLFSLYASVVHDKLKVFSLNHLQKI